MSCPGITINQINKNLVFKGQEVTMIFKTEDPKMVLSVNGIINQESGGDKHYQKEFSNTDFVVLNHELNKLPAITVIDSAKSEIRCQVTHDSNIQATISWNGITSGTIFAN
jgi:hypothetical protein